MNTRSASHISGFSLKIGRFLSKPNTQDCVRAAAWLAWRLLSFRVLWSDSWSLLRALRRLRRARKVLAGALAGQRRARDGRRYGLAKPIAWWLPSCARQPISKSNAALGRLVGRGTNPPLKSFLRRQRFGFCSWRKWRRLPSEMKNTESLAGKRMWNREALTIRRERECAEESVAFAG